DGRDLLAVHRRLHAARRARGSPVAPGTWHLAPSTLMAHKSVLDSFRLDGKVALITGGARGLGRTMARALAEAGADVALTGRTLEACQATAKELAAETGRKVHAFAGDVCVAEDVTRIAAEVTAACGS